MSQNHKTPLKLYREKVGYGLLHYDPEQEKAVAELDKLYIDLMHEHTRGKSIFDIFKKKETPKGIYIHGEVGRGKSMLMDLFFEALPGDIRKRRVHFHAFMIEVHDYFHSRREADDFNDDVDGLIAPLASLIEARSRILCFDEFHVTDVADAMILGRLFTALFEKGVIVVTTSNWEPDHLYEGGLQRDRFMPFIELLKNHVNVIHLNSSSDYRRLFLAKEGTYFHPLGSYATQRANEIFVKLTQGLRPHREILKVKGRTIVVNNTVSGVARFSFAQLCGEALGAEDYLKIAESYHTIFLEGVPKMKNDSRNEAKRLMILIDTLYDQDINLVMTADAPADQLYSGHDHKKEFERTVSRLLEMQSR